MHGEPSWSFLYRHVVRVLTENGIRCVAPDMVGFGRSGKPLHQGDYSYAQLVEWTASWSSTTSTCAKSPWSARTGAG